MSKHLERKPSSYKEEIHMGDFTREDVQQRVREKVARGDFLFPEDLARAIARELGVELEGTAFGKVAPADSPTRGDVPPFSGRPFSEEHATDHAKEAVKAYDEKYTEAKTSESVTVHKPKRTEVFDEAGDPLEDAPDAEEAAEQTTTYPDNSDSTPQPVTDPNEEPPPPNGENTQS